MEMRIFTFFGLFFLLIISLPLSGRAQVYEVELASGNYQVNLAQVTSISMHRFFVDGAFAVDEVTVDTLGNTVTRFYFVDRNRDVTAPRGIGQSLIDRAQQKVEDVKERAGAPEFLDNAVVKSYPTTTHAHTVEYRIQTKDQLDKLFEHMTASWRKKQSGKYKIE